MTVEEIARRLGGRASGNMKCEIRGIAGLESAGPEDITFAEGERSLAAAASSQAGCILVAEGVRLEGRTTIAVARPKLAFVRAAEGVLRATPPPPGIHPTALVAPNAHVAPGVSVGPYVTVEQNASVGPGTQLAAGVCVGAGSKVGAHCVLHPRVTIYPGARIGNRVILHAGVVVGSDGFGYVFADGRHNKFPQVGQVIIEDDVEIGSNSTVDRGSLGVTSIGQGTKIDNLVQVAHNVKIGRHCVIASQTGISGSVEIGDYVVMGGQVGIGDHVRIEEGAILGGGAGILPGKIVRKGEIVWGRPGRPLAEFKKMYAHLSHLPSLAQKVKELARQIQQRTE
ncbi:MAG: UDP-3-O-(3-hydroxymyristoyl)glucosamine N-acyltransferase [Terriglobia bacterium]